MHLVPDCTAVIVLKNWGSELSYILLEFFKMCLKEPCFADCWKVSLVVLVFNNLEKGLLLKTTAQLVLFSVVIKVFEKLVNNMIVDHLEKCGLFLNFSMVLGLLDQLQLF